MAMCYRAAGHRVEMKEEEEDSEEVGGIIDQDYTHSISPSERESVGPNGPIQPPLASGKTELRSGQGTGALLPETIGTYEPTQQPAAWPCGQKSNRCRIRTYSR